MAASLGLPGSGPGLREVRALAKVTQQVPLRKNNLDPIPGILWDPREGGPGSLGPRGQGGKLLQPPPSPPAIPRLLEADSKSMRSMNGSRRNSGSSLVSSSSASSNLSHLEEDTWILWGRIANEWEEWRRRKEKLLKVAQAAGLARRPGGGERLPGAPARAKGRTGGVWALSGCLARAGGDECGDQGWHPRHPPASRP